jgi:ABC-type branched-subunit amino acid transport system ATPase component
VSSAVLEVRDLEVGYAGMRVLTGLSLSLQEGEALAVLGRNGVGKSTLMRALAGLLPVTSGTIEFKGQDVTSWPPYRRPGFGFGYVPQGRRLFARLTVEENLLVGAKSARSGERDRLDQVYAMFPKLGDRRSQRAGTLSGGEQQMAAVGRALMGRPELLLLDEPSEGLAPIVVESLVDHIASASAEWGFAFVIVEQNVDAALRCVDRALILDQGKVVVDASADELRHRPALTEALSF